MRLFAIILTLCTFLSSQQSPSEWWSDASQAQRETVLWYTEHYGVSIGAKCVLESSGGKYTDHGPAEESYGDLGLSFAESKKRRPGLSERAIRRESTRDRHFQGTLAKEIDDANLYHMRFKRNPTLCAAMVYSGWINWGNPRRLNRGLLDLQWQEFLRSLGWK